MKPAITGTVTAGPLGRRAVSTLLALALSLSSLAAFPAVHASLLCHRQSTDCPMTMIKDACCTPGAPAPPANTAVAEAWSAAAKAQHRSVDWLVEAVGTLPLFETLRFKSGPADRSNPPPPPLSDHLTPLLI